jgi:hypothetical protein
MKLLFTLLFFFLLSNFANAQEFKPADQEMIFSPTAYTMPQGNAYFTDYEILLLNYTYAITHTTHIGIFTMFPMIESFTETITLGIKQNYFRSKFLQFAAYSSFTPGSQSLIIGNAVSIGQVNNGATINVVYTTVFDNSTDGGFGFSLSYRYDPSENTSVLAEFDYGFGAFDETPSLLTIAFRLRSTHLAWELGGMRPLTSGSESSLILFPILKATYYFF